MIDNQVWLSNKNIFFLMFKATFRYILMIMCYITKCKEEYEKNKIKVIIIRELIKVKLSYIYK